MIDFKTNRNVFMSSEDSKFIHYRPVEFCLKFDLIFILPSYYLKNVSGRTQRVAETYFRKQLDLNFF